MSFEESPAAVLGVERWREEKEASRESGKMSKGWFQRQRCHLNRGKPFVVMWLGCASRKGSGC